MKNLITKLLAVTFSLLYFGEISAQNDKFAIKVTQVFPAGGTVYDQTIRSSGEFENKQSELLRKYSGTNANYLMELTSPKGKETKQIQNIRWICFENGKEKRLNSKPVLPQSYPVYTEVVFFECTLYGTPKASTTKELYNHYFVQYFDNKRYFENEKDTALKYFPEKECLNKANEIFEKNKIRAGDSLSYGVEIYKIIDEKVFEIRKEFHKPKEKPTKSVTPEPEVVVVPPKNVTPNPKNVGTLPRGTNPNTKNVETLPKSTTPDQKNVETQPKNEKTDNADCFAKTATGKVDTIYRHENINECLRNLLKAIDCIKPGSTNYHDNLKNFEEKIDVILKCMEKNPQKEKIKFDKKKYFYSDNSKRKEGIKKLIEINDKFKK